MHRPEYRWAVSTQAHYPAFERMAENLADRMGPGLLIAGNPRGEGTQNLDVIRGPGYQKGSLGQRARSWLRFAAFASRCIAEVRLDFLLVLTNPPIMPHLAWALSKLLGFRYGLFVWDLYPKALVDVGIVGPGHPVVKTWRLGNHFVYRDAAFVAVLSDEMVEAVVRDGCPRSKVVVVANWTDVEAIRPVPKGENRFLRREGVTDRFVVMYSGNVGAGHSLGGLVEAADRLRGDDRFCFYVIGKGLGLDAVRADVRRRGLDSFRFLDYLPDSEFFEAIAAADLAVVSQRPGTEAMSMPSKTYTAMAAGDAILALTDPASSLGRLVAEERIGVVCNPMDGEGIAAVLLQLADDQEKVDEMGVRARRLAEDRYSVAVAVSRFEALFRKAMEAAPA